MKKILIFLLLCLSSLAYKETYIDDYLNNKDSLKENLYSIPGTGKYKTYEELKGFGEDKPYKIYFITTDLGNGITSGEIEWTDYRNLNDKELIAWKYKGKTYKNTREELYEFFFNSVQLADYLKISEDTFSEEWLEKTFGKVYDDWSNDLLYDQDVNFLVDLYRQKKYEIEHPNNIENKKEDYTAYVDTTQNFSEELKNKKNELQNDLKENWIKSNDLKKYGYEFNSDIKPFGIYKDDKLVFEMTDYDTKFEQGFNNEKEKLFSGLLVKNVKGEIYFNKKSLNEKGIKI